MQARIHWSPPGGALGRLAERGLARADRLGPIRVWQDRATSVDPGPPFAVALDSRHVAVIAELKRRSPSKGTLNASLDAPRRAQQYESAGAAALSILTEPSEFGGSLQDLTSVRNAVSLPLLRKDFLVHPVQLFEARVHGASAALLIVRALGPDDTRIMGQAAREAGLDAVYEIRDETELSWALDSGATLIGVNRRNLETLSLDDGVVEHLLPLIPRFASAIAESGISVREDVERVAAAGADAVLVGSALSIAPDPTAALARLTGVARGSTRG